MPSRPRSHTIPAAVMQHLRLQSGLSVAELAALLHCDPNRVAQWESGTSRQVGYALDALLTLVLYPPIRHLIPLAEAQRAAQEATTPPKRDHRRREYGGGKQKGEKGKKVSRERQNPPNNA